MNERRALNRTALVWILAGLFAFYIIASLFLMGTLVYTQHLHNSTKVQSIERNFIINKKVKVEVDGDSVIKYRDNFEIWFDKCKTATQFGLLPIYYTRTVEGCLVFKISPTNYLRNWCLRFNNHGAYLSTGVHSQSYFVTGSTDSLLINFYHCVAAGTTEIGTMKVSWE